MNNVLLFLLAFVIWAIVHSLTASLAFKQFVIRLFGQRMYDGFYRLAYNVVAFLTFLPVLLLAAALIPAIVLWRLPQPFNLIFVAVQVIGLVGLGISLLQTDILRFAGLGQAVRYVAGYEDVNPPPQLVTSGTYSLVRHPLYFFSLLFLWLMPVMTLSMLLFNILATVYFWVGSVYEESRLTAHFGDRYREYRQRVPRLIPIKIPI